MAIIVNDNNYDEVVKTELPVMLDLSATWCGPCKALAPIVEELATELEGKVVVGKADVEEAPGIAARFRVRSVPTVLFLKVGELKDKLVGLVSKESLLEKLKPLR